MLRMIITMTDMRTNLITTKISMLMCYIRLNDNVYIYGKLFNRHNSFQPNQHATLQGGIAHPPIQQVGLVISLIN